MIVDRPAKQNVRTGMVRHLRLLLRMTMTDSLISGPDLQ